VRSPSNEHPLLERGTADLATALLLVAATAAVFLLVAIPSTRNDVQRFDDTFLRHIVPHRTSALTAVAKGLNVLGSVVVTLPVRILAALYLAVRRRWWHLAAFVSAMVASEALIGPLKSLYDRGRPPHSLVATSGPSFPSGHAVAASVTVVALVIAFFPTGRQRAVWGVAAAIFSFAMGLSRAYLAAHWLSDAVAGTLLGVTVALTAALVVQTIRDRGLPRPSQSDPNARERAAE
jgi:membrane-associated phospholipid phosphatase